MARSARRRPLDGSLEEIEDLLASLAFAHTHLALRLQVCPPPGAALPPLGDLALTAGLFALSAALLVPAARRLASADLGRRHLVPLGLAALVLVAAFALLLDAFVDARLAPTATGWAATIAALLAYLGFHVVLLALCFAHLGARVWQGLATTRQRATFDNIALLWWGSCVQGVIVALLLWALHFAFCYVLVSVGCTEVLKGAAITPEGLRVAAGAATVLALLLGGAWLLRACRGFAAGRGDLLPKVRLASAALAFVAMLWTGLPLALVPACSGAGG